MLGATVETVVITTQTRAKVASVLERRTLTVILKVKLQLCCEVSKCSLKSNMLSGVCASATCL